MSKMLGWDAMSAEERQAKRRKGGKTAAKRLTKAQRVARAKKAVAARWKR